MKEAKIICDKEFVIGRIDPRIYGSFVEHMGRVVYGGIYEPQHPKADVDGFRTDVLEAVRSMGVTAVRYPGGNFVSMYRWQDGVGPRECRPRRLELAWRAIETNEFGTNEFMRWAGKAGVQPVLTVNLGTGGIGEALQYLEYCNFPGGTQYSELRRQHGVNDPYRVSMWCLGNEMDGAWQIGHKTAHEYGRLAAEAGKAMKRLDPGIELIACGSSLSTMDSCPDWDMEVLEQTYEVIDYLALHQYYGGQEMGTEAFLAQSLDMEEYIRTLRAAVQVVRQKKHSRKMVRFSLDEWGVWSVPSRAVTDEIADKAWEIAPAISEQIYTLEDALLFAEMQMVMLRNADVIKIACQSLLTNISACIMTENNGGIWLQTIYYPFYFFANYARGVVLYSKEKVDAYDCEAFAGVPYLDHVVVWNPDAQEVIVFFVNRSRTESVRAEISLHGFCVKSICDFIVLTAKDGKMTNQWDHGAVIPRKADTAGISGGVCTAELEPLSFSMLRLKI